MSLFIFTKIILFYLFIFFLESYFIFSCSGMFRVLSTPNRYRSNCKIVRFLLSASPKLVRKQGKVYLSSKHKRRGYLGGVRYQNRVLGKYLSL